MDVMILKTFRDKHTKETYQPGQTVEMTKKRLAEVLKNLGESYAQEIRNEEESENKEG